MNPRGTVGRILKRTKIHCYAQNMDVLGLVVSKKTIFMFISL